MQNAIEYLKILEDFDERHQSKVLHKLSEIIGISFLAMIANANDPVDIQHFGVEHEGFLRQYFVLEYGIPSHDTIQRVFEMLAPEYLQGFQWHFNDVKLYLKMKIF